MKNINTINTAVIAKAACEAGIRPDEKYTARIVSYENALIEIVFETEWNTITCYIDIDTGEVLGLMAEGKSTYELLADEYRAGRGSITAAATKKVA